MRLKLRAAVHELTRTPERRLLLFALLTRLPLAMFIYGTDDIQGWETWGRILIGGGNPYTSKYPIAWPPLWIPVATLAYSLADALHLPFHFIAKLFPIAGDMIITFVLYSQSARFGRRPYETARAYALNPVSIYVSAVHGQFDCWPALCVAMAVLMFGTPAADGRGRRAGMWLGIGAALKTWPLLILPALIAPRQMWRRRIVLSTTAVSIFVAALLGPWLLAGSIALTEPLRYRGAPGWWGLTSLVPFAQANTNDAPFRLVFYVAMIVTALVVIARELEPGRGALLLMLTFYVTTPGFGIQYLVWLLPVALVADPRNAMRYTVLATAVIAFEVLLRPHAGHIGDTIRVLPHSGYSRAYGGARDHAITVLDRLPLWVFFIYWWGTAAVTAARGRQADLRTSIE